MNGTVALYFSVNTRNCPAKITHNVSTKRHVVRGIERSKGGHQYGYSGVSRRFLNLEQPAFMSVGRLTA
jgi:hypothetical protein